MKVVYLHRLNKREEKKLKSLVKTGIKIVVPKTKNEIEKQVKNADVLIADAVEPALLKKATKIKCVLVPFSGAPLALLETMSKFPKIKLYTTKANSEIVAEFGFTLLLCLAKKIMQYDKALRRGKWETEEVSLLKSKTIGILGLGAIGQNIARIAKCFNMKVIGISKEGKISSQCKKFWDFAGSKKDLRKILKKSDYVVICLPLTNETSGLIGTQEINLMKSTAYLINIARGEIIKEKDLYQALKNKRIAGAAIDVWYNYPGEKTKTFPSKYPFHKLDNVVITPHSAYKCKEYSNLKMKKITENLNRLYIGKQPKNIF